MEKINNNTAYIIKRLNDIGGSPPGKKTLQKMVFLIEQKGINLNFDYSLHFYGPYCSALDTETTFLSADGIVQFDYSGYSHIMTIGSDFSVLPNELSSDQIEEIDRIIDSYKDRTPLDLELLTTAIYVYNALEEKTKANVINGVKKIKGSKFSQDQIMDSFLDFEFFSKDLVA